MKSFTITDEHLWDSLWIGATRYYLGRMTIAVEPFTYGLVRNWKKIDNYTRLVIQRDIEAEFSRDDAARSSGKSGMYLPLGMDCDRKSWERVRELWRKT